MAVPVIEIKINKQPLKIYDCGLMRYRECLELQKDTLEKRAQKNAPDTILLVEHEPVVTLGAHQSENKLIADENEFESSGIDVVPIKRGGGSTAHNKGQLVIYPIISLRDFEVGINEYIRELENLGMLLLEKLGVESDRKKGLPGLWVGEQKIASIGVRVSRGTTYHGIAINICNDLSIFDTIVPCGIDGVIMTSAARITDKDYDMKEVKSLAAELISQRWGLESEVVYEQYS